LTHPREKTFELEMLLFHLSPGLSHLPVYLKWASEQYRWKRYSSHACLTTFSKRLFYCFQQTEFHKRFFHTCEFLCLAISSAT